MFTDDAAHSAGPEDFGAALEQRGLHGWSNEGWNGGGRPTCQQDVHHESTLTIQRRRLVGGLLDGRRSHDHAMVGEEHDRGIADAFREISTEFSGIDLAAVLADETEFTIEHR